jgi:glycosyltransferase involved in cell wall biosynthesis
MRRYRVTLFFRRRCDTGSFSIEGSFESMMRSFPAKSRFELRAFVSSYFSTGILPRLRAILEVRQHRSHINHVTGDVHFLVFGLPGRRTILTIHDCGLMNHPNPIARRLLKWLWLDLPIRHVRYVTAVSEATKKEIIRYTGCPQEKIVVIPTTIAGGLSRVDGTFDEHCPRILHIGLAPNKNFERHVAAISDIDCRFHIVGKLEPQHIEILEKHRIQYTSAHNVSRTDMHRAYTECDLLLFASTLEGFGMPILEAQTVGRPVITSSLSSMPEVGGDGACFVDPFDIESIRNGVMKVIRDRAYRTSLIEKGFANITRFSPAAVARQYEVLYGSLIDVEA